MDSINRYGAGLSMGGGGGSDAGGAGDQLDAVTLGGSLLRGLDSLEGLARWRDEVIRLHRQLGPGAVSDSAGCSRNEWRAVRPVASSTVEALLSTGIERMRKNGELAVDTDPMTLATGLTAALRGGLLLANTARDVALLEVALDLALSFVRSHSVK